MDTRTEFDFIIVGGGSAGCVLANRLSADGRFTVLLLEAGPDAEPFWIRTPAGVGSLFFDERFNWKYQTDPEPRLADRRIYCPRGKVIGGSSAINGMLYLRGLATDFDRWASLGNPGWSWTEVQPCFSRAEARAAPSLGERSVAGLRLSQPGTQCRVTEAFIAACIGLGMQPNEDLATSGRPGVGHAHHTIGDGIRWSASRAYLRPARGRANLAVIAGALVRRVLIEARTAVGVEFQRAADLRSVRARREVILSAGAFGSPQLLMLSGIGDPVHLIDRGVKVLHPLPAVGADLQDHLGINAGFEVRAGHSLNGSLSGWRKYLHGLRYLLRRTGPLSLGVSHAVAFVSSDHTLAQPDIQLTFRPLSLAFDSRHRLRMHPFPGIQIAGAMLHPKSRGTVRLRSGDPADAPVIRGNFLSDPADERVMRAIVDWIRRVAAAPPLSQLVVREDLPGSGIRSKDALIDFIRSRSETIYHPVGTCRMGADADSVVDPRLRLRGIGRLRVADASIMPLITSGNTNSPTIMIAEKAADMVLEDASLSSH